jgi:hypothetical protein
MPKPLGGLGKLPRVPGLGGTAAYPASGIPTVVVPAPAPPRPPRAKGPPIFPRGPKLLGLGQARQVTSGPGEPPPGFAGPHVSAYEYVLYWAIAKVFHDPIEPRLPPFTGSRVGLWEYQVSTTPGDVRSTGSSVSDFLLHLPTGDLILRLDTWYFHTTAAPNIQARDDYLRIHEGGAQTRVETIYDTQFVGDPSGKAAIRAVLDAIAGQSMISPNRGGIAAQIRDQIERPVPLTGPALAF